MKKNYLLSGIAIFLLMLCGTSSAFAASWHYPTETTQELPYEEGMGTKENPYIINNAQQLALLSWNVNQRGTTFEDCYFALGNDIDLNPGFTFGKDGSVEGAGTPQQWVPIGATGVFKGNFDGKGHTIKGLYQDSLVVYQVGNSVGCVKMGLFGQVSSSTIFNVNIKNSLLNLDCSEEPVFLSVGSLAAEIARGAFHDCSSDASIIVRNLESNTKEWYFGGLVGCCSENYNAELYCEIYNCFYSGDIILQEVNSAKVGGVCGYVDNLFLMKNCTNSGDIEGGGCTGGIIGEGQGGSPDYATQFSSLIDLTNTGSITGCGSTGGIMGGNLQFIHSAQKCVNKGNITTKGSGFTGGLFGEFIGMDMIDCHNEGNVINGCGLVDYTYASNFINCYNTGDVIGSAGLVGGGLIEYANGNNDFVMKNCYNKGKVSPQKSHMGIAAGLITNVHCGTLNIENCYNEGDVVSEVSDYVSGFLAYSYGSCSELNISNSYNSGKLIAKVMCGGVLVSSSYFSFRNSKLFNVFNFGDMEVLNEFGKTIPLLNDDYLADGCKVSHCYYVQQEGLASYSSDVFEKMSASDFASGKVCVLLNEGQDPMPWGQTVGTDPYPLLNGKGNPETGIVPIVYSNKGKNGGIYNLYGKKVNTPVAQGIYVKNGKKMVLGK